MWSDMAWSNEEQDKHVITASASTEGPSTVRSFSVLHVVVVFTYFLMSSASVAQPSSCGTALLYVCTASFLLTAGGYYLFCQDSKKFSLEPLS